MKDTIYSVIVAAALIVALSSGYIAGQLQTEQRFNESCWISFCTGGDMSVCQNYRLHHTFCDSSQNICENPVTTSETWHSMMDYTCTFTNKTMDGVEQAICRCRVGVDRNVEVLYDK